MSKVIQGSGGGKAGDGAGRTPVEAKDSLRSKQFARVIDLLSEGPIWGLADADPADANAMLKSVYLNDTPVRNADGTYNFTDTKIVTRSGTQSQLPVPGFSAVEAETSVGIEVKFSSPAVRTVANDNLSALRVTLAVPQLSKQDTKTGDLNGSSVQIAIDVQKDGGGFVEKVVDTFDGKTMSRYQRTYRLETPGPGIYDVRIRRITPDSTDVTLVNKTYWDSYTELVEAQLSYPNSALIAIETDAEKFSSIPTRGYKIKGMLVRVPDNYNPTTRAYNGIWTGGFTLAWTNNPAWCFYDLLTNKRYGLGEFLSADQVDKWALYDIARYCDELVPTGLGTEQEPRFTCNLYLQTREEAYSVLNNFAAIFCGIAYWGAGSVMTVQDAPSAPVALFTAANVINGEFAYSGSSVKTRHTVALVSWNDPADLYKQKIEYVEDAEGIARFGIVQTEVVAMGCTSRGQAHRYGRRILYTERMETETITFRAGLEGLAVGPGEIITTSDPIRAGKRMGGRVAAATASTVTLDDPVTIENAASYTLWAIMPDGLVVSRAVVTPGGTTSELAVSPAFPAVPQNMSMWVLSSTMLAPELWRIVSMKEVDATQAEITALKYSPNKYAEIEEGLVLEAAPTSVLRTTQDMPKNLKVTESSYPVTQTTLATRITVSWESTGVRYEIRYRRSGDNWITLLSETCSVDIEPAQPGNYEFSVVAINSIGRRSRPAEKTAVIAGLVQDPLPVMGLSADMTSNGTVVSWSEPEGVDAYSWAYTRVALGETWLDSEVVFSAKALQANIGWLPAKINTIWAAHSNVNGKSGLPVSVLLEVLAPLQPLVSAEVWRNEVTLTWPDSVTTQPIRSYEIRVGATWATSVLETQVSAMSYTASKDVAGSYIFWVVARDVAGNVSAPGYVQVSVLPSIDEALDTLTEGLDDIVRDMTSDIDLLRVKDAFDASIAAVNTSSEIVARVDAVTAEAALRVQGLLDEAAARGTAITQANTLRQTGDDQIAATVTTLTATVATNATAATSAIQSEATTRANAIASEAAQRNTLAAQFRGDYTGTDPAALTSGLLYQERIARANADQGLAQQVTLLSAGAGEQFDYKKIWYFDAGTESWTGNGTPTMSAGWLRPADQAATPYVESPVGIDSNSVQYNQLRLRIRKVGTPTWAGKLWWRTAADSTWDAGRSIALTQPTYDGSNVGMVPVTPGWTGTIDKIRIDLSTAQTAGSYFEIDWVAVGRPSPGASSASLLDESTARASADAAESTNRQALSAALVGQSDPTGLTLATLSAGLLFQERSTRVTQDTALATSITGLTATVNANQTAATSAITGEQTARANADTAIATTVTNLTATVANNLTTAAAAITTEQNARATADGALSTRVDNLVAQTNTDRSAALAAVATEVTARTTADTANASQITLVQSQVNSVGNAINRLTNPTFSMQAAGMPSNWVVYNNSAVAEPAALTVVTGVDGYSATRVTWTGANTTTKGLSQAPIKTAMKANTWYILAFKARAVAQTNGLKVTAANTNAPVFSTFTVIKDPVLTTEWQWYVAKGRRTAGDSTDFFISIVGAGGAGTNSYEVSQPIIHEGELFAGFNEGPLEASLQLEASTRASETGGLLAKWGVSMSVNGKVSGVRMNNDGASSDFVVLTDRFAVATETAGTTKYPFVVGTINGVSSIGVNGDMYVDGTIKTRMLDAESITADKIKAGEIEAKHIKANSITADKIDTRGLTVKDLDGRVILASGGKLEWRDISPVNPNLVPSLGRWNFGGSGWRSDGSWMSEDKRSLVFPSNTFSLGASSVMNLRGDGAFNISFRAHCDVIKNITIDLFPDSLPEVGVQLKVGLHEYSIVMPGSYHSDLGNCQLRIFGGGAGQAEIGNIKLEYGATKTAWSSHEADTVGIYNRINGGNVSTYMVDAAIGRAQIGYAAIGNAQIEDAAITYAKIGNAEVGTLKIGANQVTVPKVDYRTDSVAGNGTNIVISDLWVYINEPGWVYALFTANQWYGTGARTSFVTLEIAGQSTMSGGAAVTTNAAISLSKYLGAGNHYVRVIWYGSDAGVRIDSRNLFVMGVMR